MMTINSFSYRTGLTPSALRFYDRKGLLSPNRMDNGYRLYLESQIGTALQIHSLRQADVSIENIRKYLIASLEEKSAYINNWRKETQSKLLSLQIVNRFLNGFTPDTSRSYLMRWDETKTFVWFRHHVERKKQPFHEFFQLDKKRLRESGLACVPGTYVRTRDGSKAEELVGEIGFEIKSTSYYNSALNNLKDISIEVMQPRLFAVIESTSDDDFACFAYIHFFKKYGIESVGQTIERYTDSSDILQLLIPIQYENE